MLSNRQAQAVAPILWLLGTLGVVCLQYGLSAPGWLLMILTAALVLLLPAHARAAEPAAPSVRVEYGVLLVVLVAATFFRLWRLHEVPPGCWADEAENGLETLRILGGDWFVFTPRNGGRGSLQFFWVAPFFAAVGPSVFSLRLASAAIGLVTVPAAWLFFRQHDCARTALYGAMFLALSFWHVTISRIGFDAIMTPLFDILVVLAIVRACRTDSWWWFGVAGGLAALANYGYAASRLTPLLGLAAFLTFRSALAVRRQIIGTAIAGSVFGIVLAPLAYYAWHHPDDVMQRVQHVSLVGRVVRERSVGPVLENVWATARIFHERGDVIPRHNVPERPMLDPITGVLFLAGLGLAWRRRRERAIVLMVVWLGAVLFFGGVLTDGAQALRTLSALVPVCFLAALGCQAALSRIKGPPAVVAVTALITLTGAAAYRRYFVDYAESSKVHRAFSPRAYVAGQYLREEPPSRTGFVTPGINSSVVQFVAQRDAAHVICLRPCAMEPRPDAVYVFDNEQRLPPWMKPPGYVQTMVGGREWWRQIIVVRQTPAP